MAATIKLEAAALRRALTFVRTFAADRSTPVRIFTKGGTCYAETGDTESWARTAIATGFNRKIDVSPPGKALWTALQGSGSGTVSITDRAKTLEIAHGTRTTQMAKVRVDAWTPEIPDSQGKSFAFDLHPHAADRVRPFASEDVTRPVLTGAYFEKGGLVATDSYALAHVRCSSEMDQTFLVDAGRLSQALDGRWNAEQARIEVFEKMVLVSRPDGQVGLRIIDFGPYPQWQNLIPTVDALQLRCRADALVASFAGAVEASGAVTSMTVSDDSLRLTTTDDLVSIVDTVPIESWTGPEELRELEVGIDARYVQAALDALTLGSPGSWAERADVLVDVELRAPNRAVVLRNGGEDLALIMPMRLGPNGKEGK